jgi:hypothetical protein
VGRRSGSGARSDKRKNGKSHEHVISKIFQTYAEELDMGRFEGVETPVLSKELILHVIRSAPQGASLDYILTQLDSTFRVHAYKRTVAWMLTRMVRSGDIRVMERTPEGAPVYATHAPRMSKHENGVAWTVAQLMAQETHLVNEEISHDA